MDFNGKIRIVSVGLSRVVNDSLEILLKGQADIKIIGQAGFEGDAIQLTEQLKPDVVLMGTEMPVAQCIELSREITSGNADIKILLISLDLPRHIVKQIIHAGFCGLILENPTFTELVHTIKILCRNRKCLRSVEADVSATGSVV